jgi:hypothetical protein
MYTALLGCFNDPGPGWNALRSDKNSVTDWHFAIVAFPKCHCHRIPLSPNSVKWPVAVGKIELILTVHSETITAF